MMEQNDLWVMSSVREMSSDFEKKKVRKMETTEVKMEWGIMM